MIEILCSLGMIVSLNGCAQPPDQSVNVQEIKLNVYKIENGNHSREFKFYPAHYHTRDMCGKEKRYSLKIGEKYKLQHERLPEASHERIGRGTDDFARGYFLGWADFQKNPQLNSVRLGVFAKSKDQKKLTPQILKDFVTGDISPLDMVSLTPDHGFCLDIKTVR